MSIFSILLQKSEASSRYITRWPRAVARVVDLIWQLLLIVPPVYAVIFAAGIRIDNELLFAFVVFVAALPFALLLDAIVGGLLGNTPAKVLIGLRLRDSGGHKLNIFQFVQRNFGVWIQGLSMGVLPLTVFTALWQFRQISGRRPATYDEKMYCQVFSLPNSGMRATLVILVMLILFVAFLWVRLSPINH